MGTTVFLNHTIRTGEERWTRRKRRRRVSDLRFGGGGGGGTTLRISHDV